MKSRLLVLMTLVFLAGCGQAPQATETPENESPVLETGTIPEVVVETQVPVQEPAPPRLFEAPAGNPFESLRFEIPDGMEVEYVPAIQSLNVYSVDGEGEPIDRSQIFIRFFDASQFLTLSTVTIYETTDLTIGTEEYVARRYDIEKKPGVANFPHQPAWRNERHIVTDTRKTTGRTRYYVIAQNPELDQEVYETFLETVEID